MPWSPASRPSLTRIWRPSRGCGADRGVAGEQRQRPARVADRHHDGPGPRSPQLADRALGDDAPAVHDRRCVADLLHLIRAGGRTASRCAPPPPGPGSSAGTRRSRPGRARWRARRGSAGSASRQRASAQPLAHAGRIPGHPLPGPLQHRLDPALRCGLAGRSVDAQVLPPGQVVQEPGLLGHRPHPPQRHRALRRGPDTPAAASIPRSARSARAAS